MTLIKKAAFVLLAYLWPAAAFAETPASHKAALDLVRAYVVAHNDHDIELELSFYAEDGIFVLSGGRGVAKGHAEIRKLLEFDAAVSSNVNPYGFEILEEADGVLRVDLGGVVEHSDMFRAIGFETITTDPVEGGFFIREGKLLEVRQPEFRAPCSEGLMEGFNAFSAWLKIVSPSDHDILFEGGAFQIRTELVPLWLSSLARWRQETGWRPPASIVQQCANRQ